MSAPGRRLWIRAGLVSLGVTLGLVATELVGRRFIWPPVYHNRMQIEPALGFRKLATDSTNRDERGVFAFRLNQRGFRGPELPDRDSPPAPGTSRLLFVGDSFLVAYAVRDPELMSSVAVRELARRESPAEALLAACSDYGTAQELLLLRRHLADVRPDAVVLSFYPANDVSNNSIDLFGRTAGAPGDYLRPYFVPDDRGGLEARRPHPVRSFLRGHSLVFAELEHRLLVRAEERGWDWLRLPAEHRPPEERVRAGELPRERFEVFREHPEGHPWENAWRASLALLRAVRDEVQAAGSRLLVVVIPKSHQVIDDAHRRYLDHRVVRWGGSPLGERLDWNLPERRLFHFFEEEGIDAVLLLEDLRAAAARDPDPLYSYDFHLTGRAHRIAGERIAEWFAARSDGEEPTRARLHPARPPSGSPVDLLASRPATGVIDFTEGPHREWTAGGFGVWREGWGSVGAGVPLKPNAQLVLADRGGDLLLRGALPARAKLPLKLKLKLDGHQIARFEVEEAGAFEHRVPRRKLPTELTSYPLLELHAPTTFRVEDTDYAFILQAAGFLSP